MAAPSPSSQLQHMLKSAVQAVQWTYSLFWKVCPQQGILVWGDGYYNGSIKTIKTVQPMEESTEEASLQRSQQLRKLYDSLLAEEMNKPTCRPSAALLPEDLTESEWFYLMSVSFSFPPGVGLPGESFSKQHHVWLTGANEANNKLFSRAILAKSADVQTVVCIPLLDGVIELGTIERVQEDHGLIQHVKSIFNIDHQPNLALSEQSSSDPFATSVGPHFHSAVDPLESNTNQEDDDDDDDDDDEEAESDSKTETGQNSHQSATQEPLYLGDPIIHGAEMAQAEADQPSELMQLELSEEIRLGSPDDGSNNMGLDQHMPALSQSGSQVDTQSRAEPDRHEWPLLQSQLCNDLELQVSETPQIEELAQGTNYSQTVSEILEQNFVRKSESSPIRHIGYSSKSAFSNLNFRYEHPPLHDRSQWLLKSILFNVPFLHNKYRDENYPKSPYADTEITLRKQEELCANHVLAERRRREKLNDLFVILRSLVPFVTKMDKASILGDTIEYVKQLRRRIDDLEDCDRLLKGGDPLKIGRTKKQRSVTVENRRKLRIVEGINGGMAKVVDGVPNVGNIVQVSIIECDALVELKCLYREGILIDVMETLRELLMEITAVHSSSTDGVFEAELRAKVKENSNGKKVTIVEVKRAINQVRIGSQLSKKGI